VEDNVINQTVLRRQLATCATPLFEVAVANNGQEALDLVERQPFDLVLMDIQMPVMDGLEATRRIRARGERVPIIGLSGNARQEHVDAALAAGMQQYLVKPYSRQQVVDSICRLLAEFRS
jgi:CheY-like chemotaxis protein